MRIVLAVTFALLPSPTLADDSNCRENGGFTPAQAVFIAATACRDPRRRLAGALSPRLTGGRD
jgi:hypothetical protein